MTGDTHMGYAAYRDYNLLPAGSRALPSRRHVTAIQPMLFYGEVARKLASIPSPAASSRSGCIVAPFGRILPDANDVTHLLVYRTAARAVYRLLIITRFSRAAETGATVSSRPSVAVADPQTL